MNHLIKHPVSRLIAVIMTFTLTTFALADTTLSESKPQWLPLAELIKKWDAIPLAKIQDLAEQGDAQAEHYLGYCNAEGYRIKPDPQTGVKWYQQALQNGYLPSANNLGLIYQRGVLGSIDMDKAIYYYTYAADRGLALSRFNLGCLYRDGTGVSPDPATSFRFFHLAADQGYAPAMTELYCCYWEGTAVASDHAEAMQWLNRAAQADDSRAQCLMAYRCENPEWESNGSIRYLPPPKSNEAFQWYRRAAQHNWADGQYHLGLYYLAGRVVGLDEDKGLELVRAAADKGFNDALIKLAALYARGVGEPRSEQDRPIPLLTQSGAWGQLVFRYEYGLGTERDMVAVAKCYCRLAMKTSWYYSPQWLLNKIEYQPRTGSSGTPLIFPDDGHVQILAPPQRGDNDPSDDALRYLSLYLKSSLGHQTSALEIANAYLTGQDVPESIPRAWLWFTIASQFGSAEAASQAGALASRMSADDLSKARRDLPGVFQELNQTGKTLRDLGGKL
jgi:TPR repeat protein